MPLSTQKYFDLVYDLGMHRGQDTDYYLKRGYRVVAFEANPENVEFSRNRFRDAITSGQLIIVEGAIADERVTPINGGNVIFFRNTHSTLWDRTSNEWTQRNIKVGTTNEAIEVRAINFAECLREFGIPFYLKADIVGHEAIAINALHEFENRPDYVSIRAEKYIFKKLKDEVQLLGELGYDNFKAIQQGRVHWRTVFRTENGTTRAYEFEEGASGPFGEDTDGEWQNMSQITRTYRKIFVLY